MSAEENQIEPGKRRTRVTIMSVFVVMTVFAASAASLGHLFRAAQGDKGEIGQFVIITAMLPLVVLVGVSWFFKILGRIIK